MARSVAVACGFATLLALSGCADSEPPRGAILVILDTLRADHTSLYGHERPTTPQLERIAERGVVFEQAITTSPWTLPAIAGMLSGRFPARDALPNDKLATSVVEVLSQAGFATAAFVEGGYVSRVFGLDRGFQRFEGPQGKPDIRRTFDSALAWLREHGDGRFFLLVHTFEVHMPYTRPGPFAEGLDDGGIGPSYQIPQRRLIGSGRLEVGETQRRYVQALYDDGIVEADARVGALADALVDLGLAGDTLIVVTADHGEALGERDLRALGAHGHTVYEELLRVPLLVIDPRRAFPVRRVAEPVSTLDVMPTLLDLLGVPAPAQLDGRSLVPLMEGRSQGDGVTVSTSSGPRSWTPRIAVRGGGFKLIGRLPRDDEAAAGVAVAGPYELYDLRADPEERVNLAGGEELPDQPLAEPLRRWGRTLLERGGDGVLQADTEDENVRRELEALGYVVPAGER